MKYEILMGTTKNGKLYRKEYKRSKNSNLQSKDEIQTMIADAL